VELVLPVFNGVTEKEIAVNYFDPGFIAGLGAIALVTGFVAGSYPALYLSGFQAVQTLKGSIKSSAGEIYARKGLVVFQFTLSIILIVCTIQVYNQIQFVQNKNLGYEKENLVAFTLEGEPDSWWETFRQQALTIPGIIKVSGASSRFLGRVSNTYGVNWPGKDPDSSPLFEVVRVDYDLIETLGFRITEGRGFLRDFGADSTRVIINQAAAKSMDMADPVGQTIEFWGGRQWEISGMVEDFHFQNLRVEVAPLLMVLALPGQFSLEPTGFIRVASQNIRETLTQAEDLHKEVNPAFPFDYTFLDEQYESIYKAEVRVGELSKYFALFAIIISCLGLFGLSAFTAEQRRKEIGIRKVMGATVGQLVKMLSASFTLLVAIAILISIPVSWWLMEQWLNDYAYRVDIEWWVFATAGSMAVIIAWLTVSWQSVKAALANPVNSLRSE
jgi:putative ABC transport system permease protein